MVSDHSANDPQGDASDEQSGGRQKDDEQVAVRRKKLGLLREQGHAFPNDFAPSAQCGDLIARFGEMDGEQVESESGTYKIAGRILSQVELPRRIGWLDLQPPRLACVGKEGSIDTLDV